VLTGARSMAVETRPTCHKKVLDKHGIASKEDEYGKESMFLMVARRCVNQGRKKRERRSFCDLQFSLPGQHINARRNSSPCSRSTASRRKPQ
jgi:hypothetical protein